MRNEKLAITLTISLLAFLVSLVFSVRIASAHTRIESGPYVIIIGWETEPVLVGERNALFFDVKKDGIPVEGLESTLEITVSYGGQIYTGNLQPEKIPGTYTIEILPTIRGQYSVILTGKIEDFDINEIVEPEEVLPATVLQFPETPPTTRELEESIDQLSSQLRMFMTITIAGFGLAIGGICLAIFSLWKVRKP